MASLLQNTGTNIGNMLIWGASIAHDWPFFQGQVNDPFSTPNHILRWDFEISRFPEDWQGHLLMLNVADPNAVLNGIPRWPGRAYYTPNYDWAQSGGGIVGFAHANFWTGGSFDFASLDDRTPRALILDVITEKVDFISTEFIEDPDFYWFWYQMLDAGFKIAPTGSTDWPCQSFAQGTGAHHTAFPLPNTAPLTFEAFVHAVRTSRTVIRQNTTPLDYLDLRVNGMGLGSTVELAPPPGVATIWAQTQPSGSGPVCVEVDASSAEPGAAIQLVVNSAVVDTLPIGPGLVTYQWTISLSKSSWVAARIVEGGGTRNRTHSAATFVLFERLPDPQRSRFRVAVDPLPGRLRDDGARFGELRRRQARHHPEVPGRDPQRQERLDGHCRRRFRDLPGLIACPE